MMIKNVTKAINDLYVLSLTLAKYTGGWGRGTIPPHVSFRTKQGPTVSVSNIRDIAFCGCLEIIRTRNRGNRSLHVGHSEKVQYLTLDLLKSFLMWTIQRKTNEQE